MYREQVCLIIKHFLKNINKDKFVTEIVKDLDIRIHKSAACDDNYKMAMPCHKILQETKDRTLLFLNISYMFKRRINLAETMCEAEQCHGHPMIYLIHG